MPFACITCGGVAAEAVSGIARKLSRSRKVQAVVVPLLMVFPFVCPVLLRFVLSN